MTCLQQKFARFEDVTGGKRADDIASLIFQFLVKNECLSKVVVAMSSGINGVQAKAW